MTDTGEQPVLRWVGGKARLATQLRKFIPEIGDGNKYYEPFLGAGSVFFSLRPARAVIGDLNDALISCYKQIKDRPDLVWRYLSELSRRDSDADYYQARAAFNALNDTPRKAALFVYLNRTCFNGIWRVSRAGKFNVPYGRRRRTLFPSRQTLFAVGRTLKKARLISADFETILRTARCGDFVYLDPPYPPLNGTAFFTHYTKTRFNGDDQERVSTVFRDLDQRGCRVLVSNADMSSIRELYRGYAIRSFDNTRYVAAHGRRYNVRDLLIANYELQVYFRSSIRRHRRSATLCYGTLVSQDGR